MTVKVYKVTRIRKITETVEIMATNVHEAKLKANLDAGVVYVSDAVDCYEYEPRSEADHDGT